MSIIFFRPVFYAIFIFSVFIMLDSVLKNRSVPSVRFYLYAFSVFSMGLSGLLLYQLGMMADETGNAGDPLSFYLFMAIVLVNLFTIFNVYYKKGCKETD